MGPCMCGDIYCPSCGVLQGNSRCPICGTWSLDGPCPDPARCEKAEQEYAAALARDYLIDKMLEKTAKDQKVSIIEIDLPQETWDLWKEMSLEDLKKLAES
jgi:hypothetical protein